MMTPEDGYCREEGQEAVRFIELRYFFVMLQLTTRLQDPFDLLFWYIDRGLRIMADPSPEHPIPADVIKNALVNVRAAPDIDPDDPKDKWRPWMTPIPTQYLRPSVEQDPAHDDDPEEQVWGQLAHKVPNGVGWLWVSRENFEQVCRSLGVTEYHWPLQPWPQSASDVARYSIAFCDTENTDLARAQAPVQRLDQNIDLELLHLVARDHAERRWERHNQKRQELLSAAEAVARAEWATCDRDHAQMTRWLQNEYSPDEKTLPFLDEKLTKPLRKRMLSVARQIGKPVKGVKKSPG